MHSVMAAKRINEGSGVFQLCIVVLLSVAFALFASSAAFASEGQLAPGGMTVQNNGVMQGNGSADRPYLVYDESDMKQVGKGGYSTSAHYKLMNDLDLVGGEDDQWAPIASGFDSFTGTFDGGGHTIKGLYLNNTAGGVQGLFSNIGEGGVVKDLSIEGSIIVQSLTNSETDATNQLRIGGIAGFNAGGTIKGCSFTGTVQGSFAKYVTGPSYVGGIVGENNGTIEDCSNSGLITGPVLVGGVAGLNHYKVNCCYNAGQVEALGRDYAGGVVGQNYNPSRSVVSNCYNTGFVKSAAGVGGVTGLNYGKIANSFNLTPLPDAAYVGGIAAFCGGEDGPRGTVENCYYLTDTARGAIGDRTGGHDEPGKAVVLSKEGFNDPANFTGWDFSESGDWVWSFELDRPMLARNEEPTFVAQVGDDQFMELVDALAVWTDGTTLKLLTNAKAPATVVVDAGTTKTIDLNGRALAGNFVGQEAPQGATIDVKGTLNLIDSGNTGRVMHLRGDGCGITVEPGAVLNMSGGNVTGNTGGVKAGGIDVEAGAVLNMTGGSITNNAGAVAGGLYAAGTVNMSGKIVITGNRKAAGESQTTSNLYLCKDVPLNIVGALSAGTSIGVTLQNPPGKYTKSAEGVRAADCKALFSSDDPSFSVLRTGDELKIDVHVHRFTYAAQGASITATCHDEDCDIVDGLTMTICAPANLTYDGKPKAATLQPGYNATAFPGPPAITYFRNGAQVSATDVVNVGSYVAKVAIGGATAQVSFTIVEAPNPDDPDPEIPESERVAIESAYVPDQIYTSHAVSPVPTVTAGGVPLTSGIDFVTAYESNVEVGTATAIATGRGRYKGTQTALFHIKSRALHDAQTTLTDLDLKAWYMGGDGTRGGFFPNTDTLYLDYTLARGLIGGYRNPSGNVFAFGPNDSLTRAQAAVIVYRMANPDSTDSTSDITAKDIKNTSGLPDVENGRYYTPAVNWAVANGVITGYGSPGNYFAFGPEDPVTREQLAAIIARYCTGTGGMAKPTKAADDLFKDASSISSWAKEGAAFCHENGIMRGIGDTGRFEPFDFANRAQMAKVIAVTDRAMQKG